MNEKEKYLNLYQAGGTGDNAIEAPPGKMGGGYGRICWGENMLESLKAWKAHSLLDVGCGYGNFCDAATLFVPRVYGIDIASVAAGQVVDNPDITFFDGEARHLPLEDQAVEWITSFDCLEHCLEEDIDKILSEFNRVASKGFVLSISYAPCEMDGMPLHMTVRPEAWWIEKLERYGNVTKEGRTPITHVPYLVCRKPVEKTLICYCAGGLGKRMRALAAGAEIARRTRRRLSIFWPEDDPHCRAGFSDLFDTPIQTVSTRELQALPSCKVYAHIKDVAGQALVSGNPALRQAVRKWGSTGLDALAWDDGEDHVLIYDPHQMAAVDDEPVGAFIRSLKPAAHLLQRIGTAISSFISIPKLVGVHARGSDFGVSVDAYADQMTRALGMNPAQEFLVISEDRSYEAELKVRFPGKVLLRLKSDWPQKFDPNRPWAVDNVRTSRESVFESLIDIYLLAETNFQIYHESSATAQASLCLSQKDALLTRPETHAPDSKPTDIPNAAAHSRPAPAMASPALIRHDQPGGPGYGADREPVSAQLRQANGIHYLCPDIKMPSAGIRRLYRHVDILQNSGFDAHILHLHTGFRRDDMPPVSVRYLDHHGFRSNDIIVIPEGFPAIMDALADVPCRRFAIALNWDYIFKSMPLGLDWRSFDIERVLVVSPVIGRMVAWAMGLPTHVIGSSIDHQRYFVEPGSKRPQVVYIQRKAAQIDSLMRLLAARNADFVQQIQWRGLDGLSEDEYAAQIRKSSIFLNLSAAEGFPTSCLEAMAAGSLVAGYDAVGGRDVLIGHGDHANCILAPNGDYVSLAYALDPVLTGLMDNGLQEYAAVLARARQQVADITLDHERRSLISFWDHICINHSLNFKHLNN